MITNKSLPKELGYSKLHHLCSIILSNVIRFDDCGSNILRSNDSANVSNLRHGDDVDHVLLLFHSKYSLQSDVG